ncbi:MAG: hypothetical protein HC880_02220 [Bacteroidia bacterium]|nr:hypothetical protein [Bacteroidia bacterium]
MNRRPYASLYQTNFSRLTERTLTREAESYGSLVYTLRIKPNWVYKSDVQVSLENLKERFTLGSGTSANEDSLRQSVRQRYKNIGIFQQVNGLVAKDFYWEGSLGFTYTEARLAPQVRLLANERLENISLGLYRLHGLFVETTFKKTWKFLRSLVASRLRYVYGEYNQDEAARLLWERRLSLSVNSRFAESVKYNMEAFYNREYTFLKPAQLYPGSLFTDFRSVSSYDAAVGTPQVEDLIGFSFKVRDLKKSKLTYHSSGAYVWAKNILFESLSFEQDRLNIQQIQGSTRRDLFINSSLDKYFPVLKTTVKLSHEYLNSTVPQVIEGVKDRVFLQQHTLGFVSGTVFKGGVTLSLGAKQHVYHNRWQDSRTDFSYQSYVFKTGAKPIPALGVSLGLQVANFGKNQGGLTPLMEAKAKYDSKNGQFSLSLDLSNLLNRGAAVISSLGNTLFSSTRYPLLNRFFLLSGKYKF